METVQDYVYEALRILDAINTSGRLDYGDYCELHDAISAIVPEDAPVKHGHWIIGSLAPMIVCSICNTPAAFISTATNYCPNCGAKMS